MIDGVLRTRAEAERYAKSIEERTGQRHVVFRVPPQSAAYQMGYRYGTCREDEVAAYRAGGAVFDRKRKGSVK